MKKLRTIVLGDTAADGLIYAKLDRNNKIRKLFSKCEEFSGYVFDFGRGYYCYEVSKRIPEHRLALILKYSAA